jgi:hypothetical protein
LNKISSKTTSIMKFAFPALWFGFIGVFIVTNLLTGAFRQAPAFLFIPLLLGGFGFFLMKLLVWDLIDEVYDCGDHLLLRNDGKEDSVQLADVINISSSVLTNPPRITLRLATPGKFGTEVSFSPPRRVFFNPFATHPVAEDLIVRTDQARKTRYRAAP